MIRKESDVRLGDRPNADSVLCCTRTTSGYPLKCFQSEQLFERRHLRFDIRGLDQLQPRWSEAFLVFSVSGPRFPDLRRLPQRGIRLRVDVFLELLVDEFRTFCQHSVQLVERALDRESDLRDVPTVLPTAGTQTN